mmetsp:Transcript_16297/g.44441  ORF Transcript_16297/g.44441 Transcript_16297/m.44441 type:complete len:248 (+) Transcript_16297:319-1062(+)
MPGNPSRRPSRHSPRPPRNGSAPATSRTSSHSPATSRPCSSPRPRATSPSHRRTSTSRSCSTSPASTAPASPRRPSSNDCSEASTSRSCTCRPRTGPTLQPSWTRSRRFWKRRRRDARTRARSPGLVSTPKPKRRNSRGTRRCTSSVNPWAGSSHWASRFAARTSWTVSSSSTRLRRSINPRGHPSARCSRRSRRRFTEECLTSSRPCSSNPPRSSPAGSTRWPRLRSPRDSRWTARSACRFPTWRG